MAITDNKNLWIIGLIVVVIGIFAFTNLNAVTGQAQNALPTNIKANSCDRDDTCETLNASVGGGLDVFGSSTLYGPLNVQNYITATGAIATSDAIRFYGELKPDGLTCAAGQILKKVGTDNWDCAADETGSGGSGTLSCITKSFFNNTNSSDVSCDSGYIVTGGGALCSTGTGTIKESRPLTDTAWRGSCSSGTMGTYARCCKIV